MNNKNNAYRFNPFYRNVKFPEFKSDPNAQLPEPEPIGMIGFGVGENETYSGKLWDDSEVSDAEMDDMIDEMNAMNGFPPQNNKPTIRLCSGIRIFSSHTR